MRTRLRSLWKRLFPILPVTAALASACSSGSGSSPTPTPTPSPAPIGIARLGHVVVIYLENHSFDNLYGSFGGASGLAAANGAALQIGTDGNAYATLPQPMNTSNGQPDPAFPANLANAPFLIDTYVAPNVLIPDLVHRFYQEQMQIDGGKMDRFAQVSDAKGLSMGYYATSDLALAREASRYTLCDNFFHAAFGGSFLNHIWLIAAASPTFPGGAAALPTKVAVYDSNGGGQLVQDGFLTYDGYAVNTAFSVNTPHPATVPAAQLVPNQTMPTIGDRLTAAGIDWAWYSGGWDNALAGNPDPSFQFHHQPFAYFGNYADGTAAKTAHLKDETAFFAAAQAGTLPPVSFVKPIGKSNEHPGYTDLIDGELHALELIDAVRTGPNWKDTAILVTYDEHGGFWDHVAPPVVDRWGPGSRVPTLVISPFAKKGFVDHTRYDTTSILKLIEARFSLAALSSRDGAAADMTAAFDFTQSP